jgi:galactose-1-phosphate uridylyltransferase
MFIEVFVSYSSDDEVLARQIIEHLETAGLRVWWDKKIALDVKNFESEIQQAIMAAQCFLVIWSRHSTVSDWVCDEYKFAKEYGNEIKPKIFGICVDPGRLPLGWGNRECKQLQIVNNKIATDNLTEIQENISAAIGLHGPNEHLIRPKIGAEEWDFRDLAIETPVPGLDVFTSFRPCGSGGVFLLMRLDTTDGWVDSEIDSAQDRHKAFSASAESNYTDANGRKILKVKNDVYFIMDPLRPISIQIGGMRSKRPSADPGVIGGNIPIEQLEVLPTRLEWVSMTLAEILSSEESLQYLWKRIDEYQNRWEPETLKKVKQLIAKNPHAPLQIQQSMCPFCNKQFKQYRRIPLKAEQDNVAGHQTSEEKYGSYIIANDYPFGPSFHYLAITDSPIHNWEDLKYTHIKGLNLLIHEFLEDKENTKDAAGIELGFNSTVRHLILGENTHSSAGASIPHIHKQVWGMAPRTSNLAERLIEVSQAYWNNNIDYQRSYYLALKQSGYRIWEDDNVALYIPYGQSSKHELQAMTLEPRAGFIDLNPQEVISLSKAEYIALRLFKKLKINSFNQVSLAKLLNDTRAPKFHFVQAFITREVDLAVSELSMLYVVDQHPWDSRNQILKAWSEIREDIISEFSQET